MITYSTITTITLLISLIMWYYQLGQKRRHKYNSREYLKDLNFWRDHSQEQAKEITKMKKQLDMLLK